MVRIKVSIIVPVYKVRKYINQCVQSLIHQTLNDIEIILVDDGSPDECPGICDDYANNDNRVKVIHKENGGLSSARNAGVSIACGEYVLFVDSDDWIEPNTCEVLYSYAKNNQSDIVVCSYIKEFSDHSNIAHLWNDSFICKPNDVIKRLYGPMDKELRNPQDLDLPVSACMQIIKTTIAKEVSFVDTKLIGTEDLLYQIMVYSKANKYSYIKEPYYHYRRSDYGTLTTTYMPLKFDRWQNLYDILYQKAESDKENSAIYKRALGNRIAFSMISLGLNEILSKESFFNISKRLKGFLKTDRYTNAINSLDTKWLPLHWKFFFFLCRNKLTLSLTMLLNLMEFLRTHKH